MTMAAATVARVTEFFMLSPLVNARRGTKRLAGTSVAGRKSMRNLPGHLSCLVRVDCAYPVECSTLNTVVENEPPGLSRVIRSAV
jgi:hypothetical protein